MLDPLSWALAALGSVALAAARRKPQADLDLLFARLRTASSAATANAITEQIWTCWLSHDDPDVEGLMDRGLGALDRGDYDEALAVFDEMVERAPDFAEAWNKRGTVYYLTGLFAAAVRDIKRTLALEPRHFGALSGLGAIYLLIANNRGALEAFEAILALNPLLDDVRRQIEALRGGEEE